MYTKDKLNRMMPFRWCHNDAILKPRHSSPWLQATGICQSNIDVACEVPYSGKFSRVLIFAVFADQSEATKIATAKITYHAYAKRF